MESRNSKAYAEGFLGACFAAGVMEKAACVLLARGLMGECKTKESTELLKLAAAVKELRIKETPAQE